MKINTLFGKQKTVFSLEVFPPKKTSSIEKIYDTLTELTALKPDFISVTYGAGASQADNATCDIAKRIKQLGTEPLAHLTCVNSTHQKVLDTVAGLKQEGIENILALRGDINQDLPPCRDFAHASDLIKLIRQKGDFNVAAACYPEKHYENKTLAEEVEKLKYKTEAGATHLITQLFFANKLFYEFLDLARPNGIEIPIQAGIMPIVTTRQIERTVALSGASLPHEFTQMVNKYNGNDAALFDAGIDYATRQIIDLIENGVDGIHLYTMNNPVVAKRIYNNIKPFLK